MFRLHDPLDYDNPRPRDAGTLGIWHEIANLSDGEAWRQWSELRAYPSLRALAGTRLAALRARIAGEVAP